MKKINLYLFVILSLFAFNICNVKAANTFGELKQELADLKAKKQSNTSAKNYTNNEINNKNSAIIDAQNKITESENKITEAKQLIEDTNTKISELEAKTSELMKAYQITLSNNSYIEFITDSSSMTELIMRIDAVRQITEYNKAKLNEMEELIKTNEQAQVDLKNYEAELESNITTYKSNIEDLQDDLADLEEIGMDLTDEINSKQELVDYYSKLGCSDSQTLEACAAVSGNDAWLKPLAKGRVNSIYGQRVDPFTGKIKVHQAVDIGGNSEGTSVYSIGNGVVVALVDAKNTMARTGKKVCGGNQVYIQYVIKGEYYTVLYAHLLSYNVYVGQKVTSTTVIGAQGGGSATKSWESCSTGTHLHFQVSKHKYEGYSTFVANSIVPPGYPSKNGWFYSRTQYFG